MYKFVAEGCKEAHHAAHCLSPPLPPFPPGVPPSFRHEVETWRLSLEMQHSRTKFEMSIEAVEGGYHQAKESQRDCPPLPPLPLKAGG